MEDKGQGGGIGNLYFTSSVFAKCCLAFHSNSIYPLEEKSKK